MASAVPLSDRAASPCFRHATPDVVDWYAADTPLVHATLLRLAAIHLALFPVNSLLVPAAILSVLDIGLGLVPALAWMIVSWASLAALSTRVPLRHLRITRHGLAIDALFTPWPATRLQLADRPNGVPPPPFLVPPEAHEIPFEDVEMVCFEGSLLRVVLRGQAEIQVTLDPLPPEAVRELLDDIQRARDVHMATANDDAGEAAARWELEAVLERA